MKLSQSDLSSRKVIGVLKKDEWFFGEKKVPGLDLEARCSPSNPTSCHVKVTRLFQSRPGCCSCSIWESRVGKDRHHLPTNYCNAGFKEKKEKKREERETLAKRSFRVDR